MPAPIGNQFWRKRSKHGRDAIIQSPEVLAKAADEYFQWCEDHPLITTKNFNGNVIQDHLPRVFTKEGIAIFCGVCDWKVIKRLEKDHEDFVPIISHIENVIYNQKYTMATVNVFNSNIIARDLGLKDRQDMTTNDKNIEPIKWVGEDEDQS